MSAVSRCLIFLFRDVHHLRAIPSDTTLPSVVDCSPAAVTQVGVYLSGRRTIELFMFNTYHAHTHPAFLVFVILLVGVQKEQNTNTNRHLTHSQGIHVHTVSLDNNGVI